MESGVLNQKNVKRTEAAVFTGALVVAAVIVLVTFTQPALKRLHSSQPPAPSQPSAVRKFEVREDSGSTAVNAVQALGTYPADKLEYVGVDGVGSRFAVTAESKGGDGKFSIARGTTSPAKGDQLIATLVFRLKDSAAVDSPLVGAGSALVSSDTTANLLTSGAGRVFVKAIK